MPKLPGGYKIGDKVYSKYEQGPDKNGTVSVGGRGEVLGLATDGDSTCVCVQWEGYGVPLGLPLWQLRPDGN